MSSPDDKAATFDPDIPEAPPVEKISDLSTAHVGSMIRTCGVTGELVEVTASMSGDTVKVAFREENRPFDTVVDIPAGAPCEILDGPEVSLTDVVDMKDFYAKARELDRVGKQIRANDESTEKLKELKAKLSDELLGIFAQVGESTLPFGDRRAYVHTELVPEFEVKPDGTKYGLKDLVDVFEALGRDEQVTPKTVNYNTLRGVLREIRDGMIPMPPELNKIVKIGERPEVRVGVGKRTTR